MQILLWPSLLSKVRRCRGRGLNDIFNYAHKSTPFPAPVVMNLTNDRHQFVQLSYAQNLAQNGQQMWEIRIANNIKKQGESSREDEEIKYGRIYGEENEIDAFPQS
jgi:hypothetical protein